MKRRKFLISGVSSSLFFLIFPMMKLFGRTKHSKNIYSRESEDLLAVAHKYGPEFGGGENVSI